MRKLIPISFFVLLICNLYVSYKLLSSGETIDVIWASRGMCNLNFHKGIVDQQFDTISNEKGYVFIHFDIYGYGCDAYELELNEKMDYYDIEILYEKGAFKLNGRNFPIDSTFKIKFDSVNYREPWFRYNCDLYIKNCGKILGYRTDEGDTLRLKYDNLLITGDLKVKERFNPIFFIPYFSSLALNLLLLIVMVVLKFQNRRINNAANKQLN